MASFSSQDRRNIYRAHPPKKEQLEKIFAECRSSLDSKTWERILTLCEENPDSDTLPAILELNRDKLELPAFLPELAHLELTIHKVRSGADDLPSRVEEFGVNPTLQLLQVSWKNLPSMFNAAAGHSAKPEPGEEFVLVWRDYDTGHVRTRTASDEDLLVLKIVVEEIDPREAANIGGCRWAP